MRLDAELAGHMARIALGHVAREYPHKLDHVWESDADVAQRDPRHMARQFGVEPHASPANR